MTAPIPLKTLPDAALEQYRQNTAALLALILREQQSRRAIADARAASRAHWARLEQAKGLHRDRRAIAVAAMLANGHAVAVVAARFRVGIRTVRRDARRASAFLPRLEAGGPMPGD
jgi:hypothetical protein